MNSLSLPSIPLRRWHRASAAVVASFVVVHLAFMQGARPVYRQPAVEALLLACVALQASSGLRLVVSRGRVPRAQAWSGIYLALFLLVHVAAVMTGRFMGLDTNMRFAAAGLHALPSALFFVPYYGLAVLAFFTHLGCAARNARVLAAAASIGAVAAIVIVTSLILSP